MTPVAHSRRFPALILAAIHGLTAAAALSAGRATAQGCSQPIQLRLDVAGSATSNDTLRFRVAGAGGQGFALIAIGSARGVNASPTLTLCVDPLALILPTDAIDEDGCCEGTVTLPPLPPGFAFRVFAQAAAAPLVITPGSVVTSNPVPIDIYGPTPGLSVTGVLPATGAAGTQVAIQGTGFPAGAGEITVWIGDTPVTPTAATATSIQCTLPHVGPAGPRPIAVQAGLARASAGTFTVLAPPVAGPVPGWVAIGFADMEAANAASLDATVRAAGGRIRDLDLFLASALCTTVPGQENAFGAAMLQIGASSAQQDEFSPFEAVGDPGSPNDPQRGNQWHLDLVGRSTKTGPVKPLLAMIDSGIDLTHGDMTGRRLTTRAITDLIENDANPQDTEGHGTNVAGVMVANSDNAVDVAGMVPELSLLPYREDGTREMQARAITRAVSFRSFFLGSSPVVLNFSNALPATESFRRALALLDGLGVAMVKSAGNNGGDVTYIDNAAAANYPDILLVSGLAQARTATGQLQLRGTSSRTANAIGTVPNREVDIAAPGEAIVTLTTGNGNTGAAGVAGTSFAAPQVAAALAAVWSWSPRRTGETVVAWRARVIDMLLHGCIRDVGAAGRDQLFGNGVLDLCGRTIFHTRDETLKSLRPRPEGADNAGQFQVLNHAAAGMNPAYAGDRRAFAMDRPGATAGTREIAVFDLTAQEGPTLALTFGTAGVAIGQPAFDPRTGRWIAYLAGNEIRVRNRATGQDLQLLAAGGNPWLRMTPHFSPRGDRIVFADQSSIQELPVVRNANGDITGAGAPVVRASAPATDNYVTAVYAPDAAPAANTGRLAFARRFQEGAGTRLEIYSMKLDGTGMVRLTGDGLRTAFDGLENFGPAFTPDGRKIVFHTLQYRDNDPQSWADNEYRHLVRAIPASPPAAGYGAVEVLHDSGWGLTSIPMGIPGSSVRLSSVDASRF
jgi:hypothetical protein